VPEDIYLDNSATTRVAPEVVEKMREVMLDNYGNPSSPHGLGVQAEKVLQAAREQISGILDVPLESLCFTSGGTEANNLAILGTCLQRAETSAFDRRRMITTEVEHPSVLNPCRFLEQHGFEVDYLAVDAEGRVNPGDVAEALSSDVMLVSVMHVNNEMGAIQPLIEIGRIIQAHNEQLPVRQRAYFHVDAVQSFAKLPVPLHEAHVDLMSASAHKIHGPKGAGVLYVRDGVRISPILFGGGQEGELRSGTENVPGCVGFATAAVRLVEDMEEKLEYVSGLRQAMIELVTGECPDVYVNGPGRDGVSPYVLNLSFPGARGEVMVHALEEYGIYVSTGSACSSHKHTPSPVLRAMGIDGDRLEGAIRVSFSAENTREQIEKAGRAMVAVASELRTLAGV